MFICENKTEDRIVKSVVSNATRKVRANVRRRGIGCCLLNGTGVFDGNTSPLALRAVQAIADHRVATQSQFHVLSLLCVFVSVRQC